ncbi:fibronectin type III domain-containing protein [Fulvivirgaceae bacterium BMA10]|uniref:Fibronectin type III domain-containing protein n=1 Tax=Splendidivirga corallicola TaxID=3051826 RepID=A0ABT8KWS1_9BACT|nr:fibronectin type III domain-containing protein [Fulvivirgaceae bacterium BMA10]
MMKNIKSIYKICLVLLGLLFCHLSNAQSQGLVPDSIEYNALKALYDSLGGDNWTNNTNWLQGTTSTDFHTWHGITVVNNDVGLINLGMNNLTGKIPGAIGDLQSVTSISLSNNNLTGTLPASLGTLDKLGTFIVDNNQLEGAFPQFQSTNELYFIGLTDNNFTSIPFLPGTLYYLRWFFVTGNKLTFETFEPYHNWQYFNFLNYSFAPQDNVGSQTTIEKIVGENAIMSFTIGGQNNAYQWQKFDATNSNWQDLAGETSNSLTINNITQADFGSYRCEITNSVVTSLTIHTENFDLISVGDPMPMVPSQALNYVVSNQILREGITTETAIDNLPVKYLTRNIQYLDGLGRNLQNVSVQGSPDGFDVIQPFQYDDFGRQEKEYLPYVSDDQNGIYRTEALVKNGTYHQSEQSQFYINNTGEIAGAGAAFAPRVFEDSPLNRVTEQGAPGSVWHPGLGDKTIKSHYHVNKTQDNVRLWTLSGLGLPKTNSYYGADELIIQETVDEEDNVTREFTDKRGRVVLKEVEHINSGVIEKFRTYYVYDDFDNLRYVFPPKGTEVIGNGSFEPIVQDDQILESIAYQYQYDARQRMIKKKIPGAEPIYMVYDKWDRLVLTQDGNQRNSDSWTFTKYDNLNRPVMTGITSITGDQQMVQNLVDTHYNNVNHERFELFDANAANGYTDRTYPIIGSNTNDILTVTYYDNYDFVVDAVLDNAASDYAFVPELDYSVNDQFDKLKGQITGSKTKVIGENKWLKSVSYYDDRYRVIQAITENYTGGFERVTTKYDFIGRTLETKQTHSRGNGNFNDLIVDQRFTYDHASRLLTTEHKTSGENWIILAANDYNEVGQLIEKNLHATNLQSPVYKQSIDYRYNERGWLININRGDLLEGAINVGDDASDLFGMKINYVWPLNDLYPLYMDYIPPQGEGFNFKLPLMDENAPTRNLKAPSTISFSLPDINRRSIVKPTIKSNLLKQSLRDTGKKGIGLNEMHHNVLMELFEEDKEDPEPVWTTSLIKSVKSGVLVNIIDVSDLSVELNFDASLLLASNDNRMVAASGFLMPNPPSNVTTFVNSTSSITLNWTDNTTDEYGFKIERSTSASGPFNEIGEAAPNGTSYTDNGLQAGTTYHYRILVRNPSGDAYSSVVNATTFTQNPNPPAVPSALTVSTVTTSEISLSWTDNSTTESNFIVESSATSGSGYTVLATLGPDVTTYVHSGLTSGQTVYYRVKATNVSGDSGYSSEVNGTTNAITSVPSDPSSLAAIATSSTSIDVSWIDNANNESSYILESSSTSGTGFTVLATLGASVTGYSHTNLAAGQTVYYRVKATNLLGDSNYSNEANETTTSNPNSPPAIPSNLVATGSSTTTMMITWKDNSDNEDNFIMARNTSPTGSFTMISNTIPANATSFTDTGLQPGTTYYYRMAAYNSFGESATSNTDGGTTLTVNNPPSAPSSLSASSTSMTTIDLSWTDNSSNETGFEIERSTVSGSGYTLITTTNSDITSFTDSGLTAGTTYYYQIRAINGVGQSTYTSETNATTDPLPSPPAVPSSLQATTLSASEITLNWTDNSNDEDNFVIESSSSSGTGFTTLAAVGPNVTSFTHNGLSPLETVYYRVKAVSTYGNSANSNESSATTLDVVPAIPSALAGIADLSSEVILSWSDNSNNELNFELERSTMSGSGFSLIHSPVADATSYTDTGLTPETTYYYRLRAVNAIGNSNWSSEISVQTGMNPPSNLTVTVVSHDQLDLSWSDNTGLEDNYIIERSTMVCFCAPVDEITLNASVTNYQDTGLDAETTYYYRVKASNTNSNSSWSTVAGASTLPEVLSNPDLSFSGKLYTNGNISSIEWKVKGDTITQGYAFTYDNLNRLKTASHVHKNDAHFNVNHADDGYYSVGNISYDRNGNILSLKRQARDDNGAYVIDDLSYDYATSGDRNRLISVTDTSGKTEGFNDGHSNPNEKDYGYDDNGNMTIDKNKDITSIEYNILNLPQRIVFGNGNEILYTYDATGVKLRKEVKETVDSVSKSTVTDYMTGVQYTIDDFGGSGEIITRDFLATGEGRLVMEETQTEAAKNEYQYHLTDHLDNVRVTFTTKDLPADEYLATMETSEQTQEEADFGDSYTNANVTSSPLYNHTDTTTITGADKAIWLRGSQNEIIGLAKSLTVNKGDTIDMEVYAKYTAIDPNANPSDVVGFFASAFTGAFGLGGAEGDPATYNFFNDLFSTGPIALGNHANQSGVPKAYLNFLLFDKNYMLVEGGCEPITSGALEDGSNTTHEKLSRRVIVPKEGYIYIYVSNENETLSDVFFDDFKITHRKSPIVSSDDYYPFGLTFNSAQRIGSVDQKYKFNDKELQNEFGLNWLDYGSRMYDAAVGRWNVIDDEAERGYWSSPYSYTFNNPIRYTDPDGNWPWEPKGVRHARRFAKATGGKFIKHQRQFRKRTGVAASVNINETVAFYNVRSRFRLEVGRSLTTDELESIIDINFETYEDYGFLFERPEVYLANGVTAILLEELIVVGVLPPSLISGSGNVSIEALTQYLLQFAQKGKNNHRLDPEQVERLEEILNDPNATKKEKNAAKRKLKAHEKANDERHSRQSKDKKKKGNKRNKRNRRGGKDDKEGGDPVPTE